MVRTNLEIQKYVEARCISRITAMRESGRKLRGVAMGNMQSDFFAGAMAAIHAIYAEDLNSEVFAPQVPQRWLIYTLAGRLIVPGGGK